MTENLGSVGTWRCDVCGDPLPGNLGEPPLDHMFECENATGDSLVFEESR